MSAEITIARFQPFYRSLWLAALAFAVLMSAVVFYLGLVLGNVFVTGGGIGLTLGLIVLLVLAWRNLSTERPVLEISPRGLLDRRLGPQVLWSDVIAMERHAPGTQVSLTLRVPDVKRYYRPASVFTGRPKRVRRYPAVLTVPLAGLDIRQDALAGAAFDAWRNARGPEAAAS